MKIILFTLIAVGQFVAGYFLGAAVPYLLGIGNGWELIAIPIGHTVGVWGVGALAAILRNQFDLSDYTKRLVTTGIGSAIGIGIVLVASPTGFIQILYPLFGALFGYYLVRLKGLKG